LNKTVSLVVSLWLASPAFAQNAFLNITGEINGVTNGSNYSCPAPTGPGQIFFNNVDVYTYTHPGITPPSTPAPAPANLKILGRVGTFTDAAHYACPPPTGPLQIFFNGIDVYTYIHQPTPTPTPPPATPPAPAAAPVVAPVVASTAAVKNTNPVAADAAKAQTAAAEARKKKFEGLSRKLDALADKIGASKIDAGKKSKLLLQVKNLAAKLNNPAGKPTLEAAEETYGNLKDDFVLEALIAV
jgi:hypothetical protein